MNDKLIKPCQYILINIFDFQNNLNISKKKKLVIEQYYIYCIE